MNADFALTSLKAVVALALLLASVAGHAADAAVASFDRMLAHQPGSGRPVTGADRESDPLTRAIVIPLREGAPGVPAAVDPIAESFARMFAHRPSAAAPTVPSSIGPDPLVAAIVEPLRRSLSESAAATHFARARSAADH